MGKQRLKGACKALFLDRDGVINYERSFIWRISDCVFVPGIFRLVRLAKQRGYQIIVVTNQSGIARGRFTLEDYYTLRAYIHQYFRTAGCALDAEYVSTFHPDYEADYIRLPHLQAANDML